MLCTEDTFFVDIKVESICLHDTRPELPDKVMEGDSGWVLQGVLSRASFRRLTVRNHCTSTPHRSETNGIAERAVRRVKEGTSAVLLQSGPNESWWADSMECFSYLRNVTDLLYDGKTPY